jgi:hypothetical protein
MATSISEFERTKPTKTMLALNTLLKKVKSCEKTLDIHSKEYYVCLPLSIIDDINEIKKLLKSGE